MAGSFVNDSAHEPARIVSDYLYPGDFYQLKGWSTLVEPKQSPGKGYNDCLCFVLVRKGHFCFDFCHGSYTMQTGHIVLDKPGYEYTVCPSPGELSIFNFTDACYEEIRETYNLERAFFFSNENLKILQWRASAGIDYLHYLILRRMHNSSQLEIDILVMELLKQVIESVIDKPLDPVTIPAAKKHHLAAIENAKEYMHQHFFDEISLIGLSRHCCVSPFYLSRLFKNYTVLPPYKYLQEIRLKHAELLVRNSDLPVTDICFSSGFNNADYFSTAFTKKYKVPPSAYKRLPGKK